MVVSQIPAISLPVFLFGMKDVVLLEDYNKVQSGIKQNFKYFLGSSIFGVALNRGLTKSPFYPSYFIVRFPLRMLLFFSPNFLFYQQHSRSLINTIGILRDYNQRLDRFRLTGNISYWDPKEEIFAQFQKPLLEMRGRQ